MNTIISILKNKNLVIFILLTAITLMMFFGIKSCNDDNKTKQRYENTIVALNDSLKKVVNSKGDTVFIEKAAEMTPKDIMNSALYKTLDAKTQEYIKELAKTKGLLASANATIVTQGEIIKGYQYGSGVTQTDSTVTFKKGDLVSFPYKSKNLTTDVQLTFRDSLDWKLKYKYQADITTTWTREKDKSIKIEYKLDDPNAQMVNGKAFYIPVDEQKSKLNKTLKTILTIAVPSACFIGGAYVGYKLAK